MVTTSWRTAILVFHPQTHRPGRSASRTCPTNMSIPATWTTLGQLNKPRHVLVHQKRAIMHYTTSDGRAMWHWIELRWRLPLGPDWLHNRRSWRRRWRIGLTPICCPWSRRCKLNTLEFIELGWTSTTSIWVLGNYPTSPENLQIYHLARIAYLSPCRRMDCISYICW